MQFSDLEDFFPYPIRKILSDAGQFENTLAQSLPIAYRHANINPQTPTNEIARSLYLPIAYIMSYIAANALSGDNADFNRDQQERYDLAISL